MGMLENGVWKTTDVAATAKDGSFVRKDSAFRDHVSREPGARFPAEKGRYRLYVSYACPWAHRTLVVRALKGLEDVIPISVVDPLMGERGWVFSDRPDCLPDPEGASALYEIYLRARPDYTGKVTVPVLWDTKEKTIVSNESSEILRMLNDAFDPLSERSLGDLYPERHRAEIDAINSVVYDTVNNGVYKAGFASSQEKYEESVTALFASLSMLETRLTKHTFLVGDSLSEADLRLVTTLFRFDSVYYVHFKCNLRRLVEYEHLWAFTRQMYQVPGVAETVRLDHIKQHYYRSHPSLNPRGLVPVGPLLDFSAAHHRGPVIAAAR